MDNPYEETENCSANDYTCKIQEKGLSSESEIAGAAEDVNNTKTGTYGALRVSSATWNGQHWLANATWVFAGHSPNIAAVP
jgi:hypothetical protein